MKRSGNMERKTNETEIRLTIDLDGSGRAAVDTGIGFFDHMLVLFTKHGLFDLTVKAAGDLEVDAHHTVEDIGIVLGKALAQALGDKGGIRRYGTAIVPMDEALAMVVVDVSAGLSCITKSLCRLPDRRIRRRTDRGIPAGTGGERRVDNSCPPVVRQNSHHITEAIFKALGRALAEATRTDDRIVGVMSSKGVL
jgi:imidazoleglycerol-phosphate dehydratase